MKMDLLNKLEEIWGKLYLFHPYSDKISGDVWLESLASGVELLHKEPNEATLVTVIQQLCDLLDDPLTTTYLRDNQRPKDVDADLILTKEDIEQRDRYKSLRQALENDNYHSVDLRISSNSSHSDTLKDVLSYLVCGTVMPKQLYDRFHLGWTEFSNHAYSNGQMTSYSEEIIGRRTNNSMVPQLHLDLASYATLEPYLLAINEGLQVHLELSGEPASNFKWIDVAPECRLLMRISAPERSHFPTIRKWLNQSERSIRKSGLSLLPPCTNKSIRLFASLMKCNVVLSKFSPMLANFEAPFKLITQYKKSLLEGETYEAIKVISDVSSSMRDGHGAALDSESFKEQFMPPFSAQFVGEELRINYIRSELSDLGEFKINDKIELIDGKSPNQILGELANQLNYSTPWELKAKVCYLGLFFAGPQNSIVKIQVNGKEHRLKRTTSTFDLNATLIRPKFQWFGDHIAYLNLAVLFDAMEINLILSNPQIRGLVIDARGEPVDQIISALRDYYGRNESQVLHYMIPFYRGQFLDEETALSMRGFDLKPNLHPRLTPVITALVDGYTVSTQEETVWRIRHAFGGKLFGEQTGGCDGNYTKLNLLDGIKLRFTGMGVYMPDGKDINRNGIAPDYIVPSNYQGGDLMKDHVFLAALRYLQDQDEPFSVERNRSESQINE